MNLQAIMDRMAEHFRPDAWSLLLLDEERQELYFDLAVGGAADSLKNVRLKLGEGIAGWVAKNAERLVVPDVYTDPRFAKRIDEMTKWQTRSIICVPLVSNKKVLGVVQLINVDPDSFSDHELFFLQSLCDNAAAAIDSLREIEGRAKQDPAAAAKAGQ
jgi:GAF domain-containing protein